MNVKMNIDTKGLTKGQKVILIRERKTAFVDDIVIFEGIVQSSGAKTTRFVDVFTDFDTDHVTPTIEEMEKRRVLDLCVAQNEDFIEAFITKSKQLRVDGLTRARKNLAENPTSRRFKRHVELFTGTKDIVDMRKNEEEV